MRRTLLAGLIFLSTIIGIPTMDCSNSTAQVHAAGVGQPNDWGRFYHYPYVYYPRNYSAHMRSYDSLYHRYPPEMRIPVYNPAWHNFYPTERPYHSGNHFKLDVF
ncbi:hypothetical protein Pan258_47330 [Symmachiella dynata]|uniref:Calmodulin-binding protein n=3 Tax=Planctomycetaceae TaxID=126 RepID=A0A517ZV10_9PLAN|nr:MULTISPECIES: hypothetical protein [Symmachiella]QDT50654.1 hypothetical protein Pan258_47330 [Symmachiella dynata]QDU46310.1 hypothetical protein Mal52_48280 [Symmachiella dynata]TWU14390.1 hypothetical protein CA54_32360 [Symmachiella macrocystis]|tara:strand:- start:1670 stop:1984 length:315 start_codon:yes stop_codon:yes gene_type:complete